MMGWEEEEVINLQEQDQIHTRNRRREAAETEIGKTWWCRQELLPTRNDSITGFTAWKRALAGMAGATGCTNTHKWR